MTDLSEFTRLADWLEEGQGLYANTDKKLCTEALRFRANASEEVIARVIYETAHPDDLGLSIEQINKWDEHYGEGSMTTARAVLAALEKPATATIT